jgi:hypothetical protein
MAFTVQNYPCRGIVIPSAYFKVMSFQASKTGGYSAFFGVYANKELADAAAENIINHITIHCDYEPGVDIWNLIYTKAMGLSHFDGMTLESC